MTSLWTLHHPMSEHLLYICINELVVLTNIHTKSGYRLHMALQECGNRGWERLYWLLVLMELVARCLLHREHGFCPDRQKVAQKVPWSAPGQHPVHPLFTWFIADDHQYLPAPDSYRIYQNQGCILTGFYGKLSGFICVHNGCCFTIFCCLLTTGWGLPLLLVPIRG